MGRWGWWGTKGWAGGHLGLGRSDGESRNTGVEEKKRERRDSKGLLMSSRAESSNSNRDFHIMILQQCIAYFKDLITTAY